MEFETFWERYPRKVGKLAAMRSYQKALRWATPQEIIAGVDRSMSQWSDPKFIPYPATWLNGGRWMDEYGASVPKQVAAMPMYESRPCPHVDRCNGRAQCRIATQLGRPEREQRAG